MAQVDILVDRASEVDYWPDCCTRCGAAGSRLAPVPAKYAKPVDGLIVPLCRDHFDDWARVGFRTRVGATLILIGVAATAAAVWELQPQFAGPNNPNDTTRITATIILGFLSAIPIGAIVVAWAKTPIRITQVQGRLATLTGVCRQFVKALVERPQPTLPEVSDALRFEVNDYRPVPNIEPAAMQRFLLTCFAVAGILGTAVGFGGMEIGEATIGWDANDWRYPFLAGLVTLGYVLPLMGLRVLITRVGFYTVVIALGVSVLGVLAFRLFGASNRSAFSVLFSACPFLLFEFAVVYRLIQRWRVRSVPVVIVSGSGGALAVAGIAYLIAGMDVGPHQAAYIIGPIAAVTFGSLNRLTARAPFCIECDGWLVARRIGALPRSLQEVEPILETGQIVSLTGVRPYQDAATIGDVELTMHFCPECQERGTVVLALADCRKGGKDGKTPMLVRVGRWLYPGMALPVIEELFPLLPAPRVAQEPAEPPSES